MYDPKILFKGKLYPKDIIYKYNPQLKVVNDTQIEEKINRKWDELSREAKEKEIEWFNGKTYCLNALDFKEAILHIEFSTSDFKHNQCEFFIQELIDLGENYFTKNLFTSSILETSDNQFILGVRGKKLAYRKSVDMFGGVFSQEEHLIKDSNDLFKALHKEFKEEIGIGSSTIEDEYLNYIILTDHLLVGLYFRTKLNITAHEVKEIFNAFNDKEMRDLIFLSKDKFIDTLKTLTQAKVLLAKNLEKEL